MSQGGLGVNNGQNDSKKHTNKHKKKQAGAHRPAQNSTNSANHHPPPLNRRQAGPIVNILGHDNSVCLLIVVSIQVWSTHTPFTAIGKVKFSQRNFFFTLKGECHLSGKREYHRKGLFEMCLGFYSLLKRCHDKLIQ